MKQLFLYPHLLLLCLISLFSDSSASFSFICCFICFGGPNKNESLKSRRFVSRTFSVVYDSFPLLGLRCRTLPVRPDETASCAEGRCSRYGSAIFAHFVCWELIFVLKTFFIFFRSFRRCSQLRKIVEILQNFCLFIW